MSQGGVACMAKGGMCGEGGMHGREGVHGRGHAWQGACMAGGMHGGGGEGVWQGACVAGDTTTAADGMHPTGMHS